MEAPVEGVSVPHAGGALSSSGARASPWRSLPAPSELVARAAASPDVVAGAGAALVAASAAAFLPAESAPRLLLTLPVLLFVPGYLFLEAVVGAARPPLRWVHLAASVGLSAGLVGLLAAATGLVPGGFRPASIVLVVTVACLALAAVAVARRAAA